eukprot:671779-Pleurochrysis_carterae.AAC.1
MPTPLVLDGRELLPSDSNGVGAQKESKRFIFGVSSDDSLGDQSSLKLCLPDLPGSGSSTKCCQGSLLQSSRSKAVR